MNLKRYIPLSVTITVLFLCLAKNQNEILGILIVYLGTILNHYMLVQAVRRLVLSQLENGLGDNDKKLMIFFFIGKLFILFLAIYIGWHFMGKRVIIPVLNYVLQILVLGVSLENKGSK